jgi:hypothetical protein
MTDIGAWELLQESESHWRGTLDEALRCDGSADSRHRRRLVVQALCAYEELRRRQAPAADPLTVFTRWPACTVVGLLSCAARAADRRQLDDMVAEFDPGGAPSNWRRGWGESWQRLIEQGALHPGRHAGEDTPGLTLLLAGLDPAELRSFAPELYLVPDTGSLFLRFAGRAEHAWTVHADGFRLTVTGDRCAVSTPSRVVDCRHWSGITHTVALVDPADPLLVFDEHGTLVAPGDALPNGSVWLLHPGEPPAAAFRATRRIAEELPAPPGWTQWWLGRVLTADAGAIRSHVVARDGTPVTGRWRPVAGSGSGAALHPGDPVEGLVDSHDNPVYAQAPTLTLPITPGRTWRIEVHNRDVTRPFVARHESAGGHLDLAGLFPTPALGRFRITARRTGVRGLAREVTVAEGVEVRCRPRVRLLTATGRLDGADVDVLAPPGLTADRDRVRLDGRQTEAAVVLRDARSNTASGTPGPTGAAHLDLRVRPPHVAVRKRTPNRTGPWGVVPLDFTPAEIGADTWLDLRLPAVAAEAAGGAPAFVAGFGPESPIQQLGHGTEGVRELHHVHLGALTDTLRGHDDLNIYLELPGRRATVALIRDVPVVADATCDGIRVGLLGRRRGGPVDVLVHAVLAPWFAPQRVTLDPDTDAFTLDPALRFAGPLTVTVRPAGTTDATRRITRLATDVDTVTLSVTAGAGIPAPADPIERSVVAHLAGRADPPTECAAFPYLWAAAARPGPADRLDAPTRCAQSLGTDPAPALIAASVTGLAADELVVPLIQSGLAAHRFRETPSPHQVLRVWESAPLAALLLTSPLLPYLSGHALWDPAELEPDEHALLDQVDRRCGPTARLLLTGKALPDPQDSGFGEHPERMEALPPGQLDAIVRDMNPIPAWPLDADSRFLAVLEAFAAREALREAPYDLAEYLDAVLAYAADPRLAELRAAIELRDRPANTTRRTQWQLVPALSLGCALVARQAAQHGGPAVPLERRLRGAWAWVAQHAPKLAAQDLELAECTLAGFQAHG